MDIRCRPNTLGNFSNLWTQLLHLVTHGSNFYALYSHESNNNYNGSQIGVICGTLIGSYARWDLA
jgi:hypothetical protein